MTAFKKLLFSWAVLLATATSAQAAKGFIIEETTAPAQGGGKKVTYVTDSALRIEEGDKISILTLKGATLKLYEISPKTQVIQDNSPMAAMLVLGNLFFLEDDGNGGARAKKDFFTPTDESKFVGKWKARKLIATVMGFRSEVWYTRDSKDLLDADRMRMRFFAKANEAIMMPLLQTAPPEKKRAFGAMMEAVNGFTDQTIKDYGAQVLSEANLGGVTATTQVVSVESGDNPDTLFALPKGYRMQAADGIK